MTYDAERKGERHAGVGSVDGSRREQRNETVKNKDRVCLSEWNALDAICPSPIGDRIKGALYIIQILCRRYTFWSYPAGLTMAEPPG